MITYLFVAVVLLIEVGLWIVLRRGLFADAPSPDRAVLDRILSASSESVEPRRPKPMTEKASQGFARVQRIRVNGEHGRPRRTSGRVDE